MLAQPGGQLDAPAVGVVIAFDGGAEEQLVLRLQVGFGVGVAGGIGDFGEAGPRRQMALDDGAADP